MWRRGEDGVLRPEIPLSIALCTECRRRATSAFALSARDPSGKRASRVSKGAMAWARFPCRSAAMAAVKRSFCWARLDRSDSRSASVATAPRARILRHAIREEVRAPAFGPSMLGLLGLFADGTGRASAAGSSIEGLRQEALLRTQLGDSRPHIARLEPDAGRRARCPGADGRHLHEVIAEYVVQQEGGGARLRHLVQMPHDPANERAQFGHVFACGSHVVDWGLPLPGPGGGPRSSRCESEPDGHL